MLPLPLLRLDNLWIELLVFKLFIHDNDNVISTLQIVENVEPKKNKKREIFGKYFQNLINSGLKVFINRIFYESFDITFIIL